VYGEQGNYLESLKNHFCCLIKREEIGTKQGVAMSLNNIGLVYFKQNKYSTAIITLNKGLKLAD